MSVDGMWRFRSGRLGLALPRSSYAASQVYERSSFGRNTARRTRSAVIKAMPKRYRLRGAAGYPARSAIGTHRDTTGRTPTRRAVASLVTAPITAMSAPYRAGLSWDCTIARSSKPKRRVFSLDVRIEVSFAIRNPGFETFFAMRSEYGPRPATANAGHTGQISRRC